MPWDPLNPWPKAKRWLWVLLAALACVSQGRNFLHSVDPPHDVVMDFFQEWASARNVFEGLPVYAPQRVTIGRYLGTYLPETVIVEVNAHPPTSVLLAVPLVRLDYFHALLVWNLVSLACFAVSLWIVARELKFPLSPWMIFPALTLLLFCGPLYQQNCQGQLNLVLLVLIIGGWALERHGQPWGAGALLGTATALKLFPGFLVVYFALRRQWKLVIAAAVSFALWSAITVSVLGAGIYRTYFREVVPQVANFISWWNNASLVGLSRKLFGPGTQKPWLFWKIVPIWDQPLLGRMLALVASALVVAVVAWAARRARTQFDADLAFGIATTGMLLVSPVTWDHYFLLLLLPLALVWLQLPESGLCRVAFSLVAVAFWFPPRLIARVFLPGSQENQAATSWQALTVLSIQTYALLGLFALGVVVALRRSAVPRGKQALLRAHLSEATCAV